MRSWLYVALVSSLVGCVDPKAEFEAFGERLEKKQARDKALLENELPPPAPPDGGESACIATAEGVAGTYYFVMRAAVAPDSPIPLLLTLTPSEDDPLVAELEMQPLLVKDGKTPLGAPSKGKFVIDGYRYSVPTFTVTIPGDADAVLPGVDLTVEIDMAGVLCRDAEPVTFVCGNVNGKVTVPVELGLDGSTFGARRVVDGEAYLLTPSCEEREGLE
jgi:hypothetical protein